MNSLTEHLDLLHGEVLKRIASTLAPVKGLTRKEQFAKLIEQEVRRDPGAVLRKCSEVERRVGALRPGGEALLVEAADASLAASIANEPELRALCRTAGERGLVVLRRNERAFRSALKRCGYVLPP